MRDVRCWPPHARVGVARSVLPLPRDLRFLSGGDGATRRSYARTETVLACCCTFLFDVDEVDDVLRGCCSFLSGLCVTLFQVQELVPIRSVVVHGVHAAAQHCIYLQESKWKEDGSFVGRKTRGNGVQIKFFVCFQLNCRTYCPTTGAQWTRVRVARR